MSKIRVIENKAFKGHKTIRRGGGLRISVLASGTGAPHVAGSLFYDVSGAGVYIMPDATGTALAINV